VGRLTAIVLGSAAGGAFPQWNCRCPVCELAWQGDPRVRPRTQASIAVSSGDGRWTLLNASPDLGQQLRATLQLHPQGLAPKGLAQKGLVKDGLRGSPIGAVVLTGGEIDQIAGLLSLRESTPFTLYATPSSHAAVAANAMFSAMGAMTRSAVNPGQRFTLAGDIEASLFMVPGKLPLYLEGDAPEIGAETAANVGIELTHEDKRLIFVPGAAAVSPSMRERFTKADAILFDGTLFADDEMQRSGTGVKTGRRMGHMPIDGEDGALQALGGLNARRIFVHINNTNPILIDGSPERLKVEAAGWQVAYDGMEIVL
jgi:pyrroloquinoline quinone biosynthesis protein B